MESITGRHGRQHRAAAQRCWLRLVLDSNISEGTSNRSKMALAILSVSCHVGRCGNWAVGAHWFKSPYRAWRVGDCDRKQIVRLTISRPSLETNENFVGKQHWTSKKETGNIEENPKCNGFFQHSMIHKIALCLQNGRTSARAEPKWPRTVEQTTNEPLGGSGCLFCQERATLR